MIVIECKERDDDNWYELKWPPSMDWSELKTFATHWHISIRKRNVCSGLVEREYHPYIESL